MCTIDVDIIKNKGKMKNAMLSTALCVVSALAAALAIVDALGVSVWLSASSWLLIAAVSAVWSLCTREK